MIDPSLALQIALVTALKAGAGVGVAQRVYDSVPSPVTFPYITIGDAQVLPAVGGCLEGADVSFQIDVWSRAPGYPEAKTIGAAVAAALDDADLTVAGFRVVSVLLQEIRDLRDPDGITRHVAMTFEALIDPI